VLGQVRRLPPNMIAIHRLRGRFKTRQANPYSKRTDSRVMLNHACVMMPCVVERSWPQSTDARR
jgi:hypothetical protein